jgi:predicted HicB family RNase H-like nuclease
MSEKESTKGVGIKLPADLHRKLKIKAAEQCITLKDLIIKILKENV